KVLGWSRSDGALVNLVVGDYYPATAEYTLGIATSLVALDGDESRVRETVDTYLAGLRSKGGTASP
ncbi:MAG: hypothetical protein GXX79_01565, partial [Actinomycetales bacterium]|nr:hypothetical protein [Actinomycetales bacterium]